MKYTIFTIFLLGLLAGCRNSNIDENAVNPNTVTVPAVMSYTITNVYPHDTGAFTEGLEWHNNFLCH